MSKNKKTYYLIILDKSGSMYSVMDQAVQGFNEQIQMIKNLEKKYPNQKILVSLTTFNHEIDFDIDTKKPSHLREMVPVKENSSAEEGKIIYNPGGMTALYDAIGKSVNKLRRQIKDEIKENKASAIVVILTDGHENSSQKYSYEKIKKLIRKLEKSQNWTFSYLGATPDAVEIAKGININPHNAMSFKKEEFNQAFSMTLNKSISNYMKLKEEEKIIREKFLLQDIDDKKDNKKE